MATSTLHIDKTLASLKRIESNFRENGKNAVLFTAKSLMNRIVNNTRAPAPPPPVEYYIRTNRLVSGWSPAASFVGVPTPGVTTDAQGSNEGGVNYVDNKTETAFQAINSVPYARKVEEEGTWAVGGVRRAPTGYRFMFNAVRDTEADLIQNVAFAWRVS